MNPLTAEWVEKAEEDFATATRELRVRKNPSYNAVCFHAQQCAEKYMKARLHSAGMAFPRTHNLIELLELLLPIEPLWEGLRRDLRHLSEYSVVVRYPGETADKEAATRSVKVCAEVRRLARASLQLSN
jgi:HEPN domain-containing protein